MRLISFALTRDQFEKRSKTVTRRVGWKFARPGMILRGVDRVMGFQKGERPETLGFVELVSVRRERLDAITVEDVEREGYPGKSPEWFVQKFCRGMGTKPWTIVTRLEFRYLETVKLELASGMRWDSEPGDLAMPDDDAAHDAGLPKQARRDPYG